ncbi:hypothetical protein PLCT2_00659 [Planctomycetaceae bacterium]|nr:hypothetical protein PLCT2_00659 [Planctomycetaceae bacterium]
MAQDFSNFIRFIERRLIGFLRFATLDAQLAEDLFAAACRELRQRWPSLNETTRESAAFEIAEKLVRADNRPPRDNDELAKELANLSRAHRLALCLETFGPAARESELGARLLKAAPAPSAGRQMRALRTTFKSLVAVGVSLCLCLALVAGFGALHASYPQNALEVKTPADWLGDEIKASLARESDTTYGEGALTKPAAAEAEKLAAIKADFDILTPARLPEGYYLKAARVFAPEKTGLSFTVVRLIYTDDDTELTLIEAEGGFPWLSEFVGREDKQVIHIQRQGTAVLVISRHFTNEALHEIAASLKAR